MKICKNCNIEYESGAFCKKCGSPLEENVPEVATSMFCDNCGAELPLSAKFCAQCGTAMKSVCPSCRAELLPNAKYCIECGSAMEDSGSSQKVGKRKLEKFEAVDLGLSVKWANLNLGASSHSDFSSYFAWGEIEAKEYYTEDSYSGCCPWLDESFRRGDGYREFDIDSDAAHHILGEGWRVPSMEDFQELDNNCIWKEDCVDGFSGYRIFGTTGQSIFMPKFGCRKANEDFWGLNYHFLYWTRNWDSSTLKNPAMSFVCNNGNKNFCGHRYIEGLPIRPVYCK